MTSIIDLENLYNNSGKLFFLINGYTDTGSRNLVTGIYLDYRLFDSLFEAGILLVAVSGVLWISQHNIKEKNATFIIRGVRNTDDLKFESNIAQMNADLAQNIETLFLISRAEKSHISSSIIRDIIKNKGNASRFLPKEITIKTK